MMQQRTDIEALKVRPDVFVVRSEEGAWLRNNIGSFLVKGTQSYDLVRTLLAQLDGTRSVADICAELPPDQQVALRTKLLEPLLQNGFLFTVPLTVDDVPASVAERYGEQLAFLELYVDRPFERLQRVRSQQVVCIGSGLLLRSVVVALVELGFGHVHVLTTDDETDTAALEALIAAGTGAGDGTWTLARYPASTTLDELAHMAAQRHAAGVVLASADADPAAVAAAGATARRDPDCAVGIVGTAGGFVLASPLLAGETCWECLYRSVTVAESVAPAGPSAALAAFQLAQRLFCRFAGAPVPEDRQLTTVDSRTLMVGTHVPRRHAGCPRHCAAALGPPLRAPYGDALVRPDIPTSHDGEAAVALQDRIVETVAMWTDAITGPLLSVGEDELVQLPLAASRCRVQAPRSTAASLAKAVECYAITPREARNQAILLALEWLAAEKARHDGAIGELTFGAGWSAAEAIYRAAAAAALRSALPLVTTASRFAALDALPTTPLRAFLCDSLADVGVVCTDVMVDALPSGLSVARLRMAGETVGRGVGIDAAYATDHALADGLVRRLAPVSHALVAAAYPAPPLPRWSDAVRCLERHGSGEATAFDAGRFVPFASSGVCVVALVTSAVRPAEVGA